MERRLETYDSRRAKDRLMGLFLGSGASLPWPSKLPTFRHILEGWLSHLSSLLSNLPIAEITEKQKVELSRMLKAMPPGDGRC